VGEVTRQLDITGTTPTTAAQLKAMGQRAEAALIERGLDPTTRAAAPTLNPRVRAQQENVRRTIEQLKKRHRPAI